MKSSGTITGILSLVSAGSVNTKNYSKGGAHYFMIIKKNALSLFWLIESFPPYQIISTSLQFNPFLSFYSFASQISNFAIAFSLK